MTQRPAFRDVASHVWGVFEVFSGRRVFREWRNTQQSQLTRAKGARHQSPGFLGSTTRSAGIEIVKSSVSDLCSCPLGQAFPHCGFAESS